MGLMIISNIFQWGANGGEEKPSDHRHQKKNGDDIADNDDANAFPF